MRAPGTNWAEAGHEAALATVLLDGKPQQNVMLYAGAERFTYAVFLGRLTAGRHRLCLGGERAAPTPPPVRGDGSHYNLHAPRVFARANPRHLHTGTPPILSC